MEKEELLITDLMKESLSKMAYWGKFFAVMGFIAMGLMVFGGLAMMSIGGSFAGGAYGFNPGVFGFIYIIFAVIYFFPSKYMYDFSTQCRQALNFNSQVKITDALGNLASIFTFWGVFTLIILGFYAVFFIFAILAALINL